MKHCEGQEVKIQRIRVLFSNVFTRLQGVL